MTRLWEGPGAEGCHSGCRHMGNQHGVGRGAAPGSLIFQEVSGFLTCPLLFTLSLCVLVVSRFEDRSFSAVPLTGDRGKLGSR